MVKRKNRLLSDCVREVRHTYSRFVSILLLSTLAVAFLVGLRATAPDMEYTADRYFDSKNMMDGYVLSTMGLTDGDIEALSRMEGIEDVEGVWSVDATAVDNIVTLRSMPQRLNQLHVVRGRLPEQAGECVTEELLLKQLGLDVGDTLSVTLPEGSENSLTATEYTIVGTVQSPLYVSTERGTTTLGSGSIDAFVYLPRENFTMDIYTTAFFTGQGLQELDSYSKAYDEKMTALVDSLDGLSKERAQIRDQQVRQEAQQKLEEARKELSEGMAQLEDARVKLEKARIQLDQGWAEYKQGTSALEMAVSQGKEKLEEMKAELEEHQRQYQIRLNQFQQDTDSYLGSQDRLEGERERVTQGYQAYWDALKPFEGTPQYDAVVEQLAPQKAQLDAAQAQLEVEFAKLDEAKTQLDAAQAQLSQAEQQSRLGQEGYEAGQQALREQQRQGKGTLAQAKAALDQGESEYRKGQDEYQKAQEEAGLEQAQADIDQAQKNLDELDACQWYVLGRDTNAGFVGYSQDAERVKNLASIFPVIFFVVAALACLTTMSRMVEEQRTQIGALKAMGFSRLAISQKYIGYAFVASLIGGLIGLGIGATLIPAVIAGAFKIIYAIPGLEYRMQLPLFVLSVLIAVASTTGAAVWACLSTLMENPANLMRPRAPKVGKRVFLEYIKPLWSRMSFTWKVTMRNLFRYQRRFWMTVIGIGGCTALIVTGFGLHESIFSVLDKQFDEISRYDATIGLDEGITQEQKVAIETYLNGEKQVNDYLLSYQKMTKVLSKEGSCEAYLSGVSNQDTFAQFVDLRHRTDNNPVILSDNGVVIDEKMSELLDVSVGDTITLDGEKRVDVTVADITENYVSHYVYITPGLYEQLYGHPYQDNVVLVDYAANAGTEVSNRTSETVMKMDGVTSYSYIATMRDSFAKSMDAINYAVIIIVVAAAALAFVVLYNLTNINITERMRELATLKVLGFYDRETTAYVLRENIFLTIFGILLGMVMGCFLHGWMVLTVEVDLVMFGRTAPPYAYLLAAALTALFALIVNIVAHYKLKKVNMVESLKTVE